jgi:putative peptidoglycan lipid II flippase
VTTDQAIARAGLVVTGAYLAARILGYVRTVVISSTFGATSDLDAFLAAFRIPDLMYQLVAAGALSSALIPVLAGLLAAGEESRAWRVASTVSTLMLVTLTIICLVAWVLAPELVPIFTPGFDEATLEEAIALTRIMLVAPILLAAGAAATSILNARQLFAAAALAPISYNLTIVIATILLAPLFGVEGVAIGVVAGAAAHVLVQLRPLRTTGFRFSRRPETADRAARRTFALLGPRAVGLGAAQFALIALTAFASTVGAGAITAFAVAFALLQIPLGLIGVPLGVVLLPALSSRHSEGAVAEYVRLVTRPVRLLLVVMVPIAALGIVLAYEVVTILFGYGNYSEEAVAASAVTLTVLLIGLPAHASIAILARAFYAAQDTRTPVIAALVAVAINVVVGYLVVATAALPGLAAAVALGAWVEAAMLLLVLWRRVAGMDLAGVLRTLLLTGLAALVAAIVAALVRDVASQPLDTTRTIGALIVAIMATAAGGVAFAAMSLVLRIREVPAATAILIGIARRPRAS